MKYEVIKTNIDTPLKKGVLTADGRISEMCSDGLTVIRINMGLYMIDDVKPIAIQLKEIAPPQPDETRAWYQSRYGEEQYINDLSEWSHHIANLKTYDVSDELADYIIENKLTEVEDRVDFELLPDIAVPLTKKDELQDLKQDYINQAAELRSLKQSILESGLKKYFPKKEMSFHDKVVFAISDLTDKQEMQKKDWINRVSKINQTFEDEFKAEYNSPELLWEKIVGKLKYGDDEEMQELITDFCFQELTEIKAATICERVAKWWEKTQVKKQA